MSDVDALIWRGEAEPRLRSHGVVVEILDGPPDMERIRAAHAWATERVPRLAERVVEDPLLLMPPSWTAVEVDLDYHVRHVGLAEPAGLDGLLDLARVLLMSPFDRSRALWEVVVVEGVGDGKAAYLLKIHHAMADGKAMVELLDLLHSDRPEPTANKPTLATSERADSDDTLYGAAGTLISAGGRLGQAAARTLWSAVPRAGRALTAPYATATGVVETLGSLVRVAGEPPGVPSPLLQPRGLSRRLVAVEVKMDELRAAGRAASGSLNDAYVAALAGCLRRYHEAHGAEVEDLPLALPVSLRTRSGEGSGNQIASARIALPSATEDADERIRLVRSRVRAARAEPMLDLMGTVAPVLSRLPGPALKRLALQAVAAVDLQASNIPGLTRPAYLAGSRIEQTYVFGPAPGVAIMTTLFSQERNCFVGVTLDAGAVPDTDVFEACLQEGLNEVLALAKPRSRAEA